jgi:hypothetical protein
MTDRLGETFAAQVARGVLGPDPVRWAAEVMLLDSGVTRAFAHDRQVR